MNAVTGKIKRYLGLWLTTLVVVAGAISCGDVRNGPSPTQTPYISPNQPTPIVRIGVNGLWSGELGHSIVVDAGPNPDTNAWTIYPGANQKMTCVAVATDDGWKLDPCTALPDPASNLFRGMIVTIPRTAGQPGHLSYFTTGGYVDAEIRRVEPSSDTANAHGVVRVWNWSGSRAGCFRTNGIWVADAMVFAPCITGAVTILDAPTGQEIGSAIPPPGTPGGGGFAALEVTVSGDRLYVATTAKGLLVYDIAVAASPRLVGQYIVEAPLDSEERAVNFHTLTLSEDGRLLYVVNQSHPRTDVRVLDITADSPREVGRYRIPDTTQLLNGAHDLALTTRHGRTYAYLSRLRSGLFVLDVTDPAEITQVGSIYWPDTMSHSGAFFEQDGHSYFAHADEGFDKGLTVLNVDDITKPEIVSIFKSRPGISIHNLKVHDGIAYIAYYVDGLRIVDLRDPTAPREFAFYDTVDSSQESTLFSGSWGVHLYGGLIFVSDTRSGILAFRHTATP